MRITPMREVVNKPIPVREHFWRAAATKVRAFVEGKSAEQVLREHYPEDQVTSVILRGAVKPAITTDPAWAGPLAALSVSEAVQDVVSLSVLGRLMASGGLHIDLGRFASVVVPGRSTTPADAGQWVAEGSPIPARQYSLLGPTLRPHKLSVIATFTREMSEASNIEAILRALMLEAAGPAVDAAILSAAASSPQKSAGLLNGLTPLTPSTATGFDACGRDLGLLVGDIAKRNGGAYAMFVASPSQATAIRFFSGGQFTPDPNRDMPVAASAALPDKTVMVIEPSSFASTIGAPEFEVGTVATIQQEDTSPADIVGGNSPGTPAYPTKSMFQIDAIALKMTVWCDWCMRAPHVSFMNAVAW
jgi:hypothetical protein